MKCLLDRIKIFYQDASGKSLELKKLINIIYKEKKNGFYIRAPKMKSKKGKETVVSYIIRYAGRPVMAKTKITEKWNIPYSNWGLIYSSLQIIFEGRI